MVDNNTLTLKFQTNLESIKPFEHAPKIAVALSGGIDSMALLLMTNEWISQNGGELVAITVNHNLRPESDLEALEVNKICSALNIKHIILNWQHEGIKSNIQAQAREARYKLLTDYCKKHDILHLFVGHHLQDKVENFFIKLSRASGIFGLTENSYTFINNVRVCRPLFNFTKEECTKLLKQKSISHVDDLSNTKKIYLRNSLRLSFEEALGESQLLMRRVAESQQYLAYSAQLIQEKVIETFCETTTIFDTGFALLKLAEFRKQPKEIQHYLLTFLLTIISGQVSPPRSEQINNLINNLQSDQFKCTTLNKCIIDFADHNLIIFKECCQIENDLSITDQNLWDNRFRIYTKNSELKIGYLTKQDYLNLKDKLVLDKISEAKGHKQKILFTLPVIKRLEKIVSVPNINYYDGFCSDDIKCVFEPQYISKIIHIPIA